jgi:phosphatidylinositol alpha-mannosyltransferase
MNIHGPLFGEEKIRQAYKRGVIALSKIGSFFEGVSLIGYYTAQRLWNITPPARTRKVRRGDPLRIGIVTEYYYPVLGGITEHVHNFALELIRKGHEPTIITPEAGAYDRDIGPLEGRVVKVGRSIPIYSNDSYARISAGTRMGRDLDETFKRGKFDLVHVHAPITPTLPLLAVQRAPCPVIGTFHTHFESSRWMDMWKGPARKIVDKMDSMLGVSPICISSIKRFYPEYSYSVIPNGVNTEWFHPSTTPLHELKDGCFNILYVGRFDPRNGLGMLIDAFETLSKRHPETRLVVMGYGPLERYYRDRIPESVSSRVVFTGRIDEMRPSYYASCDLMCIPAKKGSFGITLIEGMASGLPLVTSDIEGFRFVMKDGREGLMVPEGEGTNGFVRALDRLMSNSGLRRSMAANARKRALDFSWVKVTEQLLDHYYDMLEAEPSAHGQDAPEKRSHVLESGFTGRWGHRAQQLS